MAQKKRQEEDELKRKKREQRKKAECLEEQKQVKEKKRQEQLRQDCAQVNSAFLDKLDRHEKGREKTPMRKADVSHSPLSTDGQEKPGPHPEESYSGQMMQNDLDEDEYLERYQYENLEWALMKLMVNLPELSRVFLEDILDQCAGDYQRAHTLLKHTMT
ncbi:regulator of nonsense transcripts 3A [Hippocampus zosterae]|uniref:regulator of nonsense transcripts 3A n=1 Tax=Hippocampus zosterae TaxID=109293 RepID=UPI00223D6B0B|nr:regulator of nonsense transcripts 3A [Hippocampus zosterae]